MNVRNRDIQKWESDEIRTLLSRFQTQICIRTSQLGTKTRPFDIIFLLYLKQSRLVKISNLGCPYFGISPISDASGNGTHVNCLKSKLLPISGIDCMYWKKMPLSEKYLRTPMGLFINDVTPARGGTSTIVALDTIA